MSILNGLCIFGMLLPSGVSVVKLALTSQVQGGEDS